MLRTTTRSRDLPPNKQTDMEVLGSIQITALGLARVGRQVAGLCTVTQSQLAAGLGTIHLSTMEFRVLGFGLRILGCRVQVLWGVEIPGYGFRA